MILIALAAVSCGGLKESRSAAATAPDNRFATSYFDALLTGTRGVTKELPAISGAADTAAARVFSGGDLFIASVRPDFVAEGMTRSGGLELLKEYTADSRLSSKDAVIFSWSNTAPDQDLALARALHSTGAFVVGIGPSPPAPAELSKLVSVLLKSSIDAPPAVLEVFKGQTYPLVSLQNLTLLWTFTGEFVSALTRRGRMPVMLQSVLVPGARERNLAFRGRKFHPQTSVPAIPAGQLGQAYVSTLAESFAALRNEEVGSIEKAAQACVNVRKNGHQVYAWLISHFPNHQPGSPGDPGYMHQFARISGEVPQVSEVAPALKSGDLFFFLGYYRRPAEVYAAAHRAGAQVVEVITGMGKPETAPPQPDYIIHPRWPFGDALVPVPNYDIKILPSSGIVQASIWWAVVGSMAVEEGRTDKIIRSARFVQIRPGTFLMGSDREDEEEKPVHEVTITRLFEIQATEVTQAEWEAVMGHNPSEFQGADRPVENVTWDDTQEFIRRLNARQDGHLYRLPTEAEWEYSCRAGTRDEYAGKLGDLAWYLDNSGKQTHPVARKQANQWGLYDMNGNVWEWVQDYHAAYSSAPAKDPQGPASGSTRVVRGCGWGGAANICTSAFRDALAPVRRDGALGFRLVRIAH